MEHPAVRMKQDKKQNIKILDLEHSAGKPNKNCFKVLIDLH